MKNLILLFALFLVINLSATIINIPSDQPTIQAGINTAVDGDTVLVQPGTYFENINFNGKLVAVGSLFFTTQDTSYISQTIIDANNISNAVKFENQENFNAILAGFKIIDGFSSATGGGIYINNSSPTILNCLFSLNRARGIMVIYDCSPIIKNCIFSNNFGRGISCSWDGNPIIEGVEIIDNHSSGIWCNHSNPVIKNTIISNNTAEDCGAGIFLNYSSPILSNVQISNNYAVPEPHPDATSWGAGIYMYGISSPILVNVLIEGNTAYGPGAAISAGSDSQVTLINSTITNNFSYNQVSTYGVITSYNSNLILYDCILWDNYPIELSISNSVLSTNFSNIQGGESGINIYGNSTINWLEGNISNDPLFSESGDHPFSLSELSPCIDTGIPDTTGLNLPPFDIMDNLRIWDGDGNGNAIIDMGAYEFGAEPYVGVINSELPIHNYYLANYPNPFNPSTTIEFFIKNDSKVELSVYNIKGQKIKTLIQKNFNKGTHSIVWNGNDNSGKLVSSGIYYYKLNVNGKTEAVRKCLLLK